MNSPLYHSTARNELECVPSRATWPPSWMNQPITSNELDDDYEFGERAAIMEFDGGVSRDEAERRAGLRPNRDTSR